MKKKTTIIIGVILLASLLIPIPQALFTFILGALLTASLAFLLITTLRKKLFNPAPKIFSILLIIIVGLELHFTKNLIFGWDYNIFGEQIGRLNYIISFIILGVIFVFNLFFTINFIYKETIKFDPITDVNSNTFNINQESDYTENNNPEKKLVPNKKEYYYSELQQAHKKLAQISIFTGLFTIIQIVDCFLKRFIILEPTIGNVVGFSFITFITIIILEIAAFVAAKKIRK